MSLAASLVALAAAAPMAGYATDRPSPVSNPAPEAHYSVVASASARVVILRSATIRFDRTGGPPQGIEAIHRQTTRRGPRVLVEFY